MWKVRVHAETDMFIEWDGEEERMCLLLGICGDLNGRVIEAMKELLVNIWNKRTSANPMNLRVDGSDYGYVIPVWGCSLFFQSLWVTGCQWVCCCLGRGYVPSCIAACC